MPHWSLLALGTACCTTAADLALRALLRLGFTVRLGLGLSCCLTALLGLPWLLLWPPPLDGPALLAALLASGLVNALAFWAYGRGVARGDFSLALPLLNLSPLVLLASGWLLLGERPQPVAALGVGLLVLGALLLRSSAAAGRPLWQAPGAAEMLLTAVLWGVGASIDKLGVRSGSGLLCGRGARGGDQAAQHPAGQPGRGALARRAGRGPAPAGGGPDVQRRPGRAAGRPRLNGRGTRSCSMGPPPFCFSCPLGPRHPPHRCADRGRRRVRHGAAV